MPSVVDNYSSSSSSSASSTSSSSSAALPASVSASSSSSVHLPLTQSQIVFAIQTIEKLLNRVRQALKCVINLHIDILVMESDVIQLIDETKELHADLLETDRLDKLIELLKDFNGPTVAHEWPYPLLMETTIDIEAEDIVMTANQKCNNCCCYNINNHPNILNNNRIGNTVTNVNINHDNINNIRTTQRPLLEIDPLLMLNLQKTVPVPSPAHFPVLIPPMMPSTFTITTSTTTTPTTSDKLATVPAAVPAPAATEGDADGDNDNGNCS